MTGPRVIAFELTRKCRFGCIHCRALASDDKSLTQLSTSQCRSILKSVADYSKCLVILTGGEPLERDDIFDLASYCRELGLSTALATCGYLVTEDAVKKLKHAGVGAFSLSLDGATQQSHDYFRRTPGAFDAVIDAAGIIRGSGLRFQINTTITRHNFSEIGNIADLAKQLGSACFNAFILVPTGRGKDISPEILDANRYEQVLSELLTLKQAGSIDVRVTCGPQFARIGLQSGKYEPGEIKGCLGGTQFGFISYKGDLQMCGFCDIPAGNLIENHFDFKSAWENSNFFKSIRDLKSYKGNCGTCEYVNICRGCRARALGLTGDYLQSDPICSYKPRRSQ
jgi:radical SAM protein with 4Fe4S-binding SPASM domain